MKRLWKRWLCVTLAVALLAVFPIHTLGEEEVMEWTYDNSIVVTIKTDTPQQFTPEDFPEINCKRVVTVYKHSEDGTEGKSGISYRLVLVLMSSGEYVEKAMEVAKKDPRVTNVERNSDYEQFKSWIKLNHSEYTLKIGETVDLQIADSAIEYYADHKVGVFFIIDPAVIDDNNLSKSSFEQYGVFHFWPCNRSDIPSLGFSWPSIDDPTLEGCKSNANRYYAVADDDSLALEMANRLARENGILSVWVAFNPELVVGGTYEPRHDWSTEGTAETIRFLPKCSSNHKFVTIQGLTPGSVTVTLTVTNAKMQFSDSCVIRVIDEYQNGDINRDGDINASDALLALQHSVRRITLDVESHALADMDGNGEIDAADALKILQISVGLLS